MIRKKLGALARRRNRAPRPDHSERGAALVEFALVSSLILTLMFGTFEMGDAWSDSQLVTQAARSGARAAAQLGVDDDTDAFIVESIEATLGDMAPYVSRIVIYDASAADGSMPGSCQNATAPGASGLCSVYDTSDFGTYTSWTNGSWAPADRDNSAPATDFVGVRVEIDRPFITGFFGSNTLDLGDTAVMAIEPTAGS